MGRALLRLIWGAVVLTIIAALVVAWGYARFTGPGPLAVARNVVIPAGTGLEGIAAVLRGAGVISDGYVFVIGARAFDRARSLKAGEYHVPAKASPRDVMEILASGKTVVRRLTIPEGLTVAEVIDRLELAEGLVGEVERPEEGMLLPETYHFSYGDRRDELIERMRSSMQDVLARQWEARAPDLPLASPEEALVLASIVERETGIARERGLVAGVFVNRLRRGMRLQSDPTVAYGIAPDGLDRPLTRADLKAETPYNTYVIKGLPPTPIANPGIDAIRAVMNPIETDYLYFVADGTGGHAFARTLQEHNRNVRKWRKIRDAD
ncbi:endolytic transglycosylase MltG [Nisaea acidiphila]|uniref:Endolytic murein transglycosylase n=1 Tax=Nisaea acidiphila TaxID=1862145 RepID=A0A9J7AP31_9PROT|nr:endolytic transglycosylase MltG [Nisaea acidiphila]UUX49387.1 endolytic transglycosylase MltG [Nisaea acidiphila]